MLRLDGVSEQRYPVDSKKKAKPFFARFLRVLITFRRYELLYKPADIVIRNGSFVGKTYIFKMY